MIRLVVDACVARSAGGVAATDGHSINCRKVLEKISTNNHRLVITHKISLEWDNHESRFAKKWRVVMVSRKQVDFLKESKSDGLEQEAHTWLSDGKLSKNDFAALRKDCHILAAASLTDRTIITTDLPIWDLCKRVFSAKPCLTEINWIEPKDF